MAMLPFPDEKLLAASADAVLKVLRNHYVYTKGMRYLPDSSQKELAERLARAALFNAWLLPDHDALVDFSQKMQAAALVFLDKQR